MGLVRGPERRNKGATVLPTCFPVAPLTKFLCQWEILDLDHNYSLQSSHSFESICDSITLGCSNS